MTSTDVASEPWEVVVPAMLRENRSAVLAGNDSIGSRVIGSNLAQLQEGGGGRNLFSALAVAPEDVSIPMAVLELIWSSHRGVEPPLDRVATFY